MCKTISLTSKDNKKLKQGKAETKKNNCLIKRGRHKRRDNYLHPRDAQTISQSEASTLWLQI